MHSTTLKTVGTVVSAAAIISGGTTMMAVAAPLDAAGAAGATDAATAQTAESQVVTKTVQQRGVEGTFSYSQDVLSSNERISSIFCKAAAALCVSMPEYGAQIAAEQGICVSGAESFNGTVSDMAASDGASSYTMACSCATNAAGGGAIANADVEGVSLETIMRMAGVTD